MSRNLLPCTNVSIKSVTASLLAFFTAFDNSLSAK